MHMERTPLSWKRWAKVEVYRTSCRGENMAPNYATPRLMHDRVVAVHRVRARVTANLFNASGDAPVGLPVDEARPEHRAPRHEERRAPLSRAEQNEWLGMTRAEK